MFSCVYNYHKSIHFVFFQQLSKDVQINIADGKTDSTDVSEKKARWETTLKEFNPQTMSMKAYQKKMQKKVRKEKNRNVKRTDDLTDALEKFSGLNDSNDDYDFDSFDK